MSEIKSPYPSPHPADQASLTPDTGQPARSSAPKVIGILHVIYASLGIVTGLIGYFSSTVVAAFPANTGGGADRAMRIQEAFEKTLTYTYLDATVRILLGVVLLLSGLKLLKYKAAGLKLSNTWALCRIIWAIIFVSISYSATMAYQDAVFAEMRETAMMKSFGTFGLVFGIILIAVYPIVSYFILNRANVKKDLS